MSEALLQVANLRYTYGGARRRTWRRESARPLPAVADLSFRMHPGRTLGLIGESGSGKSTAARAMMQLSRPDSGSVLFDGQELTTMRGSELRRARRDMQMVFQDPFGSFDPHLKIGDSLQEPLQLHGMLDRPGREERVHELLDAVGMPRSTLDRLPRNLSGGQLQRLNIARALAVSPRVVVADEPTSALDVSIQAQIVNLLQSIQDDAGVTLLLITHDLALISLVAQDVIVLFRGVVMERGPVADVLQRPAHPYTISLVNSVSLPDPALERERQQRLLAEPDPIIPVTTADAAGVAREEGGAPLPTHPACLYADRCGHAQSICRTVVPPRVELRTGHEAACHFAQSIAATPELVQDRVAVAPASRAGGAS